MVTQVASGEVRVDPYDEEIEEQDVYVTVTDEDMDDHPNLVVEDVARLKAVDAVSGAARTLEADIK